ncbi:MAG: type II toxin-antitoxin system HicB family antitoxin [Chloroflexi bacterium]|nr:type II toxin-antitoxin system HicB family antitoxin [Chloroflexota bacterium]
MLAKKRQFTVILEPEPDGGYSVHCPALPGCVSQGDDRKSALANIQEAIVLALEVFEDKDSAAFAALALEAVNGIPFPPRESPDVVLDEIKVIMQAQKEDGLPVRMEIEQVEVNSPVSA